MNAKNKLRMLLIAASFFTSFTLAQPIVKLWDKTIGGSGADQNIANMLITPSKKIMVACISQSDVGFDKTASRTDTIYCTNGCPGTWVFSLDKNGNKLWDQTYGGRANLGGTKVFGLVQQNSNSFMLGCDILPTDSTGDITDPYIFPGTVNGSGIWILDIDSLGNKLWNKRYFAQWMGFYYNDMILNDDNIYMSFTGGATQSFVNQYGNFFPPLCYQGSMNDPSSVICKIDTRTKAFKWSFYFHSDIGYSLFKNKPNSLLMGGFSDSIIVCNKTMGSHGISDFGLVSTDTLGNIQWQKNYGGSSYDNLAEVIGTNDGGYLLYGSTWSPQGFDISQTGYNDTSLWVVKIDSLGTKIWDKRFGSCKKTGVVNNNFGYGKYLANHLAISTSDGGFLLATSIKGVPCGDVTEAARGALDYWLIKIDQNGIKQWDKRFGCLGDNYVESLAEMDTGIYVVGGTVASSVFGTGNSGIGGDKTETSRGGGDTWFVCFADTTTANLTSINEIIQKQITLNVWPNPANDVLNYTLTGNEKIKNIILTNILGERILEVNSPTNNAIQISQLPSGVYLFNCETTKGKRYVKKVVVTK